MKVSVMIRESHLNRADIEVMTAAYLELNVDKYEDVLKDPLVIETAGPITPIILSRGVKMKRYVSGCEWKWDGVGYSQSIAVLEE